MDRSIVEKALEIARYYPSGDNCQCFRFRHETDFLHVDYCADAAEHSLVYDTSLIILTLGGLLEYLRNAFLELGYPVKFELHLQGLDCHRNHPSIACLQLVDHTNSSGPKGFHDYFSAYPQYTSETLMARVTDRRKFLPPEQKALDAVKNERPWQFVDCHIFTELEDNALQFFSCCESHIWKSVDIIKDIADAIRFGQNNIATGLPWRNLGVSREELLPIKLVQLAPWLIPLFSFLGIQKLMQHSQQQLWQSARACTVLTYKQGLSSEQRVFASMEIMNFILGLTKAGFAMQPSTLSTECLNHSFKPEKNLQTECGLPLDNLQNQSQSIRKYMDCPTDEFAWLLRVGIPTTSFPDAARTQRQPVNDLLL